MNYSTAVFLINNECRAIVCTYEAGDKAPRTTFKTLDPNIAVGDFVVVSTDTRHGMTVCKVVDVDVDVDFDSPVHMGWIIERVDNARYEQTLKQETKAIQVVKSAELRKKRDELRDAMFKDHLETLKSLELSTIDASLPSPDSATKK
jgi:hypothetical protein